MAYQRRPDGGIDDCALANFDEEDGCRTCGGRCPDRDALAPTASINRRLNPPAFTPADPTALRDWFAADFGPERAVANYDVALTERCPGCGGSGCLACAGTGLRRPILSRVYHGDVPAEPTVLVGAGFHHLRLCPDCGCDLGAVEREGKVGHLCAAARPARPEVLTNSRLSTFRLCQRRHFYAYELLRRPRVPARALTWGQIAHDGLAAWWAAGMAASIPASRRLPGMLLEFERALARARDAGSEIDDFDEASMLSMMHAYNARWLPEADRYETLAVRRRWGAPLVDPASGEADPEFDLAGEWDVVVRDAADGRAWVVEHKTTSRSLEPGSAYWRRLRLDTQCSMYLAGAKALGYDPAGVIYDVLAKPSIRPLLATPEADRKFTKGTRCVKKCPGASCPKCGGGEWREAPKLYAAQRDRDESLDEFRLRLAEHYAAEPEALMQRAAVVRLEAEEIEAAKDTWLHARQLRAALRLGQYPRNPDACFAGETACPYWEVCTGAASIDDDGKFRTASHKHEELNR